MKKVGDKIILTFDDLNYSIVDTKENLIYFRLQTKSCTMSYFTKCVLSVIKVCSDYIMLSLSIKGNDINISIFKDDFTTLEIMYDTILKN